MRPVVYKEGFSSPTLSPLFDCLYFHPPPYPSRRRQTIARHVGGKNNRRSLHLPDWPRKEGSCGKCIARRCFSSGQTQSMDQEDVQALLLLAYCFPEFLYQWIRWFIDGRHQRDEDISKVSQLTTERRLRYPLILWQLFQYERCWKQYRISILHLHHRQHCWIIFLWSFHRLVGPKMGYVHWRQYHYYRNLCSGSLHQQGHVHWGAFHSWFWCCYLRYCCEPSHHASVELQRLRTSRVPHMLPRWPIPLGGEPLPGCTTPFGLSVVSQRHGFFGELRVCFLDTPIKIVAPIANYVSRHQERSLMETSHLASSLCFWWRYHWLPLLS